jgi:hypothetical protein
MGGWKTKLTVNDMGDSDRLELLCRKCGQVRYLTKPSLLERNAGQLRLHQIEARAVCKIFGCKGAMRMALIRPHKISAFIGGMA